MTTRVVHACPVSRILPLKSLLVAVACLLGGQHAQALDLLKSYQLALRQDANYQASRAETAASRELLPQARAQMMPNLSSDLMRGKNETTSDVPGPLGQNVSSFERYNSSSYSLTLRQPLFRKFNFAQYKQAQSQVASAEATLDKSLQDLLVRLCGAYFDALKAQDDLAAVLSAKQAFEAQLASANRAFIAGQGTRTDIDDAQARYDMALAQELEANQNVEYTRRQLTVIINQPAENLSLLNPERMELVAPVPANPEEWISRGEDDNAELRSIRANIEAAEQEVEKAKSGHYPTVDLVVQRGRDLSASQITIDQYYLTTQAGLQISIPIFSGGFVNSQMRQAVANLDKLRAQYEARRREVGLQIRKEFQNVAEGILKIRAQAQAERSSNQAVYSNQQGFRAGTRTQIDVLNAEQQRVNVRRDLASARYQYMMARIRLQALVGSLNEVEIGAINSWLSESGG
jgi:outer membrane protein, protease secretion system